MVSARRPIPPAPPGLWDRPEMADALTRRDMGAILTIYRRWTGATQTQIAAVCEIPQSHVSEIQNRRRQVTTLEIFERFADGIAIPRARLGLASRPGDPDTGAADVPPGLVRIYPNRGAVPGETWRALLAGAREHIDILTVAGPILPDEHGDFLPLLRARAEQGTAVRCTLGDPDSPMVALRGEEETGGDLTALTRMALASMGWLRDVPGFELCLHATAPYNSIYRFDGDMLVATHTYGAPAAHSPVLHLRNTPDTPGGLFAHYAASFERVWATATHPDPASARRGLDEAAEGKNPHSTIIASNSVLDRRATAEETGPTGDQPAGYGDPTAPAAQYPAHTWTDAHPQRIIPGILLADGPKPEIITTEIEWPPSRQGRHTYDDVERLWGPKTALEMLVETGGEEMERRLFLAQSGFAFANLANPWLLDPLDRVVDLSEGRRIGDSTVDDIEAITAARRRMDDAIGGGSLLSAVREDMRVVTHLLSRTSYTAAVGRRLYAAAAEQARLASWLCFDTGRHDLARRYTLVALRAAHAAEDRQVGANVLGFGSYQAGIQGDGISAEAFARTALAGGRGRLSSAVEGSVHARLGMARARLGDLPGAAAAFDDAETLLAASDTDAEPEWIYWFTPGDLHGIAGQAYILADRPDLALGHLGSAVAGTDESMVRDRVLWLSTTATAQVRNGQVDEGKDTAEKALEILSQDLESGRVTEVFSGFCDALRATDPASARDFTERLAV